MLQMVAAELHTNSTKDEQIQKSKLPWTAQYVGIPYGRFGRTREKADCWGLVRLVMLEQHRIFLPKWDTVDTRSIHEITEAVDRERALNCWVPVIGPDAMREFDFLIMRQPVREQGRLVSADIHIGMAAPGCMVLHVQQDDSAVLQPFAKLQSRVTAIYRHKELA